MQQEIEPYKIRKIPNEDPSQVINHKGGNTAGEKKITVTSQNIIRGERKKNEESNKTIESSASKWQKEFPHERTQEETKKVTNKNNVCSGNRAERTQKS